MPRPGMLGYAAKEAKRAARAIACELDLDRPDLGDRQTDMRRWCRRVSVSASFDCQRHQPDIQRELRDLPYERLFSDADIRRTHKRDQGAFDSVGLEASAPMDLNKGRRDKGHERLWHPAPTRRPAGQRTAIKKEAEVRRNRSEEGDVPCWRPSQPRAVCSLTADAALGYGGPLPDAEILATDTTAIITDLGRSPPRRPAGELQASGEADHPARRRGPAPLAATRRRVLLVDSWDHDARALPRLRRGLRFSGGAARHRRNSPAAVSSAIGADVRLRRASQGTR